MFVPAGVKEKLTNCELRTAGSVIVTIVSKVQRFPSSIVTVYTPALRLSAAFPISEFDQVIVYGSVPPVADTLAVPSEPPKH